MSYILDALRRADSERERERGRVPGLNAQPIPPESIDVGPRRRHRPWIWVLAGISLGLLLPLAWHLTAGEESADDTAAGRARAPVAGTVALQTPAPQPPALPPAPQPPTPTAVPAPAAATVPAPGGSVAGPEVVAAPPKAVAVTKPAPPVTAAAKSAAAKTRKPPSRAGDEPQAEPPPAPTPPEIRIPKLAELPDEVRRIVPPLAFGGSVYSEVPAQRMVILNGQLLREGEALSADLTLEAIRAKSAVLRIKGERFELMF